MLTLKVGIRRLKKTIVIYAAALAAAVFALEWLEYHKFMRTLKSEIYVVLLAMGFTVLGLWVGIRLTRRPTETAFKKNTTAIRALGITEREFAALELLALGQSNKEIALVMKVSPNTVKTHVTRLYEKLEVHSRVQAVRAARELRVIP